jgi:hypothetical protein
VDENNQKTNNKKNMGKRTKNLRGGPPSMDVINFAWQGCYRRSRQKRGLTEHKRRSLGDQHKGEKKSVRDNINLLGPCIWNI